jgi:hypothetical protein
MKYLHCRIADWGELVDWFEIDYNDDDSINAEEVRKKLSAIILETTGNPSEVTKFQIGQLRKYVKAIAKADTSYPRPIWIGLSKIKDDYTFIQFLSTLLEHLWV